MPSFFYTSRVYVVSSSPFGSPFSPREIVIAHFVLTVNKQKQIPHSPIRDPNSLFLF